MRRYLCLLMLLAACSAEMAARDPRVITRSEYIEINHKMKPYAAKARKTLPLVKQRYHQGLPEGDRLLVTVKLYDADDSFEFAQVSVADWTDEQLLGTITSPLYVVQSYQEGELINFKEDAIVDWTILKADGSREGDYVGRFLRTCGASH